MFQGGMTGQCLLAYAAAKGALLSVLAHAAATAALQFGSMLESAHSCAAVQECMCTTSDAAVQVF
jgi:hypothetical protein